MIKTVLEILKREISSVNQEFYCEIEYDGKYLPERVDIRIFHDGVVPVSELVLNRLLNTGTIKRGLNNEPNMVTVEMPSEEEIEYGFCGIKFERIIVDVDKDLQDKEIDAFLQVFNKEVEV